MDNWQKPNDNLFVFADDWHNNACIQRQSFDEYAYSFYEGARALAEAVWTEDRQIYLDAAIYPITFMYRHYVQLSLKSMISILRRLEKSRKDYPMTHNLAELWKEARELLTEHYAPETIPGIEGMDSLIANFNEHDPHSVSFRYPTDKQGNQSLAGLRHINLRHLYEAMERVSYFLDCIGADVSSHLEYVMNAESEQHS
jgi:HEPN domain-containing protein